MMLLQRTGTDDALLAALENWQFLRETRIQKNNSQGLIAWSLDSCRLSHHWNDSM
eukprot:CAMPEP_0204632060 /NCGR_PEP_ID=MMETSP0717-20131115/24052_1 /ASSEMBLY_ACC=CAM_ASM_000666 /TAXON_ID=230516 /ORGANISM="Chaetoceros curvisetus" /LENGTH=54 /DNA_ID=CAMNT_0051649801 /DNA_START=8 /DNA_END=169 /DNA_ORIENTATION=-